MVQIDSLVAIGKNARDSSHVLTLVPWSFKIKVKTNLCSIVTEGTKPSTVA